MPISRIEMERDASQDNARHLPLAQHRIFARDAAMSLIVVAAVLAAAAVWSLT